jgi:LmbE family N-acetylglucosaminyl deacetylase
MLALELESLAAAQGGVLCIGAHCDDIEIGCGGTLLRLRELNPALEIHWLVLCSDERRRREGLDAAQRFLGEAYEKRVRILSHRAASPTRAAGEGGFRSLSTMRPDRLNALSGRPAQDRSISG